MIDLSPFTAKEIRTCSRLLRKAGKSGVSAHDLIELADYLTEQSVIVPKHKRKRKRTPEERAARKEALAKTDYGKRKFRP